MEDELEGTEIGGGGAGEVIDGNSDQNVVLSSLKTSIFICKNNLLDRFDSILFCDSQDMHNFFKSIICPAF